MSVLPLPGGLLPDGSIPVLLSATSTELLRSEARAVLDYAQRHEAATPAAVAATLSATRVPRRYRALVRARARTDLVEALAAVADGARHPAVETAEASAEPKIAFVFPGQGNQRPGMGKLFYESSPAFRAEALRVESAFQDLFGLSPLAYVRGDGQAHAETATVVQPALFLQMMGLVAMWRAAGVSPQAVIGHSLGEVVAAHVAGLLSLHDAIRIVVVRARTADKLSLDGFAMAVLGMGKQACESMMADHVGWAEVAVVNAPNLVGVAGDAQTVAQLVAQTRAAGAFARQIRNPYPAHISLMNKHKDDFIKELTGQLEHAELLGSSMECVGSSLGEVLREGSNSSEHWFKNVRNPVRFDRAVAVAAERGVDVFVELSEHPTLVAPTVETLSAAFDSVLVVGTSRRTAEDLGEFAKNLAEVAARVGGFSPPRATGGQPRIAEPLLRGFPHAPMSPQRFWEPFAWPGLEFTAPDRADVAAPAKSAPVQHVPTEEAVGSSPVDVVRERWEPTRPGNARALGAVLVVDPLGQCRAFAEQVKAAADRDGSAVSAVVGSLGEAELRADTVVLLAPELVERDAQAAVDALAEFCAACRVLSGSGGRRRRYVLVTTNGESVAGGGRGTSPLFGGMAHSGLAAAFRCLAYEHPEHRFAHLDLEAGTAPTREAAERVLEAARSESEPELVVRDGAFLAKRLEFAPAADGSRLDLSHVVVFGGTGSFGSQLCEHFCAHGARALTLVSRSGPSASDTASLDRLRSRFGVRIEVLSCDVTDQEAVRQLAARQAEPASLVLHAAVNHGYGLMPELDRQSVELACAAKVVGAQHVLDHWPKTEGARVVLFSSAAAMIGGRGQVLYAAANRMLDSLASSARASGADCVSVQWGAWRSDRPLRFEGLGEMTNEALLLAVEDAGLIGMDPAQAASAGLAAHDGNVAAVAADWGRMRAYLDGFGSSALLRGLDAHDGREASVERDQQPAPDLEQEQEQAASGSVSVAERVRYELAEVMGFSDDADAIDGSIPLVALGLDSLLALELRKRIRAAVSHDVPLQQIMGGASLDDMVAILIGQNRLTGQNIEVKA